MAVMVTSNSGAPCPLQRRTLQQQVDLLSQEVSRLEQELDEAQERGDRAMLQANHSDHAHELTCHSFVQVSQAKAECAQVARHVSICFCSLPHSLADQARREHQAAVTKAEGLSARVEELEAELDDAMMQCEGVRQRLVPHAATTASTGHHTETDQLQHEVGRLQQLLDTAQASRVMMQARVDLCEKLERDNASLLLQLQRQQQDMDGLQQELHRPGAGQASVFSSSRDAGQDSPVDGIGLFASPIVNKHSRSQHQRQQRFQNAVTAGSPDVFLPSSPSIRAKDAEAEFIARHNQNMHQITCQRMSPLPLLADML